MMFPYADVKPGYLARVRDLGFAAGVVAAIVVMASTEALANMTITTPTIDMTTMGSYATVVCAALAGVWLVRKFTKVSNRS